MKFEKLLKKIHYDPNGTQLSALLKQNDKLCWQKCCSALQANTDQLKTYEVKLIVVIYNFIIYIYIYSQTHLL